MTCRIELSVYSKIVRIIFAIDLTSCENQFKQINVVWDMSCWLMSIHISYLFEYFVLRKNVEKSK